MRGCQVSPVRCAPLFEADQGIQGTVPIIHFGTGNPALVPDMAACGAEVMALDWRSLVTWDTARATAVQGNLDPIALLAEERLCCRRPIEF